MKKIISVLLLALSLTVLSSCIIINTPTHTMYFYNNTSTKVYDWFLKDSDGDNHLPSEGWNEVPAYKYDKMTGLSEDYYTVWFCLLTTGNKDYYVHTENSFHIDSDTTFYLKTETCSNGSPRSANSTDSDTNDEELVLIDSNGNQYKLVLEIK